MIDVLKERRTRKTSYRLLENDKEIDSFKTENYPLMIMQVVKYRDKEYKLQADSLSTIDYLLKGVECKREKEFYYCYKGLIGKSLVARMVLATDTVLGLLTLVLVLVSSVILFLASKTVYAVLFLTAGFIGYKLGVYHKIFITVLLKKFGKEIIDELNDNGGISNEDK